MPINIHIPSDTDPRMQEEIYQRLAKFSPEEKLRRVINFCVFGREVIRSNIRQTHPDASSAEQRFLFARRVLGGDLAEKYYSYKNS